MGDSSNTGVTIPNAVEFGDGDEPPSLTPTHSTRHPAWSDVPDADWNDWRWQSQHAVRHPKQLLDLIPFSDAERRALETLQTHYKLAIPPYYFSLIDRFDPEDPIRLQSVPSPMELAGATGADGEDDPLDEDKDSPVPGLTHRYPDRALLVTTHVCTMYCRFCTRKRATMKRGGWDSVSRDDHRMIDYVRDHPEIRDVILSGGDPLTLPLEKLEFFLTSLDAIPHLDVIRVGTRVPVTLPQRVDDEELLAVLSVSDKVWIQTHFNHPREVTPEARRACDRLRLLGMPINNHAVLLKGVNDSLAVQRDLCRALLRIKVRPYYLFHCDPVTGAGHFRTPVWKGIEIIEGLRGHTSGLGVPTYVVDAPRGGGKIPLMPNYLISAANDAVVLRNYEGMMIRYHPTGEPVGASEPVVTQGVSGLLEGQAEVLTPEGTPRLARRRARLASDADGQANRVAERSRPGERAREKEWQRPVRERALKIGLAFDLAPDAEGAGHDGPDDRYEEFDKPETIRALADVLRGEGHEVVLLGDGRPFLENVLAGAPDLVWNMAEGVGAGRCREARVPAALEMLGVPYTGSDPLTLAASLDKDVAKRLVREAGVRVPRGLTFGAAVVGGAESLAERLGAFSAGVAPPWIVKPAFEGSSKGIRTRCLVDDETQALEVLRSLLIDYGQPVLVEEYVEGDEVTVGLLGEAEGAEVLGTMRVVPRGPNDRFVYSLEVKRDWKARVAYEVPAFPPGPALERLERAALIAYRALGCRDVARIDFRVRDGIPYFLEANPLPGLAPGWSDLGILASALGLSHGDLILKILDAALKRTGLAASPVEVSRP